MDVHELVARYAAGLFPMDDGDADPPPPELPWWACDPRAVFELDDASLDAFDRRLRRSLRAAQPGWRLTTDTNFEAVLDRCARPRGEGDGVWLTPRMRELYRTLREAGLAHTFQLVDDNDALVAGIVCVALGRAAMLESMCHTVPHAGNVLLARTLRALAGAGCQLCDIQTPTDHTLRLGARLIPRAEYEARLAAALRPPGTADSAS